MLRLQCSSSRLFQLHCWELVQRALQPNGVAQLRTSKAQLMHCSANPIKSLQATVLQTQIRLWYKACVVCRQFSRQVEQSVTR